MIGRRLGHYQILEKVGAGGMGEVYRARDVRLERDVAVKVLPAGALSDDTARARLLREARIASALNHPHLCTVFDVGEADDHTYVAMEFVVGESLRERLAGGPLPVEQVIRYGAQIAEALEHAHERGILHGDLKSSNVMITSGDRAKVLDFGLARRLRGSEVKEATDVLHAEQLHSSERTRDVISEIQPGEFAGTLHYMAPELLRGEPLRQPGDLWSLGVVLYEMSAGERPFKGATAFELSSAILHDPPPPLPAQVPAPLAAVILRCLAKDPAQRGQQASEVRASLEGVDPRTSSLRSAAAGVEVRQRPLRWARWLGGLGAAATLALAVVLGLNLGGWRGRLRGEATQASIQSLAVLPLEDLSGNSGEAYFADGMTETLITDLAQISALRVISRTSVMQYKGVHKPLPQIAEELGVDAVVEGSVLRSGNWVRITAQLVRAVPEQHLWANSYDRELRDVLSVHSEVARAIAQEIRVALTPQEQARLAAAPAVNPVAHEAYLKGRYYFNKQGEGEAALRKSIEYYQQAIREDPNYALAYAGLAGAYQSLSSFYLPPREAMPQAKAAALKALELDPNLAEAHAVLGMVHLAYAWDWAGTEQEVKRALELNPNSPAAHDLYAAYLTALGRHEQAIAESEQAQRLDPLNLNLKIYEEFYLFLARRYDALVENCQQVLELEPKLDFPRMMLSLALIRKGEAAQAIVEAQKARSVAQSPLTLAAVGGVLAEAGQRAEAEKLLVELKEIVKHRYVCSYEVAPIFLNLGKKDEAFRWLERAYSDRSDCMPWLKTDPRFDSVRDDPRFRDLMQRMKFPQD